jgi:hypothetical protein
VLQRVLQLKQKQRSEHRIATKPLLGSLNNYKVHGFMLRACSERTSRKTRGGVEVEVLLGCIHQQAVNSRFIWHTLLPIQYRIRLEYHNFHPPPSRRLLVRLF